MIGLIVCFIVLKFGTQLANTVQDTYKNYKAWAPLLGFFFQIVAIGILYAVTSGIATPYFGANQWAYPLIFLLIALIPTIKVVTSIVNALDSTTSTKHNQN
jgi:membrane associated rhomboid family serine protease